MILNPNDLRVGNLIFDYSTNSNSGITKVDFEILSYLSQSPQNNRFSAIPIDLTWSQAFGFTEVEPLVFSKPEMESWRIQYWQFGSYFTWTTDFYGELMHRISLPIKIGTVHHLQNVYYFATGIELSRYNKPG